MQPCGSKTADQIEPDEVHVLPHETEMFLLQTDARVSVRLSGASGRSTPPSNRTFRGASPVNNTLSQLLSNELEYELNFGGADSEMRKSELTLVLIEFLFVGCLGVDRCYMGQPCLGAVKGLTFGGLGVWAVLDLVAVVVTSLSQADNINAFGYRAELTNVLPAFWATIIFILVPICVPCVAFCWASVRILNQYLFADEDTEEMKAKPQLQESPDQFAERLEQKLREQPLEEQGTSRGSERLRNTPTCFEWRSFLSAFGLARSNRPSGSSRQPVQVQSADPSSSSG